MNSKQSVLPSPKQIGIIFISVLTILSIPFTAMFFTNEVDWSLFDFAVMALLLLVTRFGIAFVLRLVKKRTTRIILCSAIVLALLLVWAELAVGIFGTPFAGS